MLLHKHDKRTAANGKHVEILPEYDSHTIKKLLRCNEQVPNQSEQSLATTRALYKSTPPDNSYVQNLEDNIVSIASIERYTKHMKLKRYFWIIQQRPQPLQYRGQH